MASLVDINVLVALLHARHRHSPEAVQWLDRQGPGSVSICRVTQMGALRLLTQPSVMEEDVLSAAEFWRGWDQIREDDRFHLVPEPEGLERVWREVTMSFPEGQSAGTDTYFAAFAQSAGSTLVTFDRGFRLFPTIQVDVLP